MEGFRPFNSLDATGSMLDSDELGLASDELGLASNELGLASGFSLSMTGIIQWPWDHEESLKI